MSEWPGCEQSIHNQNPKHIVCSDQHCSTFQNTTTYHDNCANANPLEPISTMQCLMKDGSTTDIPYNSTTQSYDIGACYTAGGNAQMCYCCCACYVVGTPISLLSGTNRTEQTKTTKAIEQFNIGDLVLTASVKINNNKVNLSWKESIVGFSNGTDKGNAHMIFIHYGAISNNTTKGKIIITTPDHLFLMPNGKMKRADTLIPQDPNNKNVGDMLVTSEGAPVPVRFATPGIWKKGVHHIAASLSSGEKYQKFDGNTDGHFIESNGVVCGDYYLQIHQKELQAMGLMDNLDKVAALGSEAYFKQNTHINKLAVAPDSKVTKVNYNLPSGFNAFLSPNINNIPNYAGKFFTDMQAADVASKGDFNSIVSQAGKDNINYLFKLYGAFYPNINFYLDWPSTQVNAYAFFAHGKQNVVISGQLVRLKGIYYEALAYIIGFCVARMQGNKPYTEVYNEPLTYVGAADFYATSDIMRKVLYQNYTDEVINNLFTQIEQLFDYISDSNKQGNQDNIASNPSIDCRYNSMTTGVVGGRVLPCAGGGTIGGLKIINSEIKQVDETSSWELSISFNKELDKTTVSELQNYKVTDAKQIVSQTIKVVSATIGVEDEKLLNLNLTFSNTADNSQFILVISNIEAMDSSTLSSDKNTILFNLQ